jgi:5-hydroxyisourate hydrolase
MSQLTTHILDTSKGKPANGVSISLFKQNNNDWDLLSAGITNDDGRIPDLLKKDDLLVFGIYKMKFETESYFQQQNIKTFYPYAEIVFTIDSNDHYHIPLLLNPYGYSTYRGS